MSHSALCIVWKQTCMGVALAWAINSLVYAAVHCILIPTYKNNKTKHIHLQEYLK